MPKSKFRLQTKCSERGRIHVHHAARSGRLRPVDDLRHHREACWPLRYAAPPRLANRTPLCRRRVEVYVKSRNLAVARDDEIHTGVHRRFAFSARSPTPSVPNCAEPVGHHVAYKQNGDASPGDRPRTCPTRHGRRARQAARTARSRQYRVLELQPFDVPNHPRHKLPEDCG